MTVRIVSNVDVQTQLGCGYCGDPDTPAVAVVHGYPRREFRYTPINPDGVGVERRDVDREVRDDRTRDAAGRE